MSDLEWHCKRAACGYGIEVVGRDAAAWDELRTAQNAHLELHEDAKAFARAMAAGAHA